jgi:hypothetical protein
MRSYVALRKAMFVGSYHTAHAAGGRDRDYGEEKGRGER